MEEAPTTAASVEVGTVPASQLVGSDQDSFVPPTTQLLTRFKFAQEAYQNYVEPRFQHSKEPKQQDSKVAACFLNSIQGDCTSMAGAIRKIIQNGTEVIIPNNDACW